MRSFRTSGAAAPASSCEAVRAAVTPVLEALEDRRLFAVALAPESSVQDETPAEFEFFGEYVATRGNLVAVGRPGAAGDGVLKIFDRTTGQLAAIAPNPIENPDQDFDGSRFGQAITFIDDNHVAVNDYEGYIGDLETPVVHIFTLNGGTPSVVTIANPGGVEDFGNSLAAVGGDLLVSAPSDGSGSGAVYRYNVDGTPVDVNASADGISNVYTVDGTTGFGLTMATDADADGSTMLFSSGDGATRRTYEIGFGGNVVATYEEADDANAAGSFAIAFNDGSVFVGDPNVGRVTQFARATGAIVGAITDGASSGFGSSVVTVDGGHVVIAAQNSGVVLVYDADFGDGANAAVATTEGTQSFASLGVVKNLDGQRIAVTDPSADFAAGRIYVFDLAQLDADNGTLAIEGTTGNDRITVTQSGSTVSITVNGAPVPFTGDRIVINGGAGSDVIGIAASVTVPVEVYGGAGNDFMSGGGSADILVGGDGNDVLLGAGGRDLLIGGMGEDIILGMAADDVLIAGYTAHDAKPETLRAIVAIWTNADRDYGSRVNELQDGLLAADVNVFDDNAGDILAGNQGTDWFMFNYQGPNARDIVLDRASAEERTDLDFLPIG